ncbi:MAG: ABC transporter substrate-binding protein [Actinomycetota bacterium]|nr:ABC transporter substrate-binding protein [Actinomycetota bacterium]
MTRTIRIRRLAPVLLVAAMVAGACNGTAPAAQNGEAGSEQATLRLGYFPNITHATAIVGVEKGVFNKSLGTDVTLETATFNSGPEAVEALFSDAIDASFVGPNPAINAWQQSQGEAIRIVSGATSGGAFLIVRKGIDAAEDLCGKTLSSPDLGNTQDVALRAWLKDQGLETDLEGGGDVSIVPQENAQILETFRSGDIDGAWMPEPWGTRLIDEGGGKVLVDERDLWAGGEYVTTHLIVASTFLDEHPDVIKKLLEGVVAANDFVNDNPDEAKDIVNDGIEALTGARMPDETMDKAWENLVFTLDPIASSLRKSAEDAVEVGLLEPVDLDGIYDLSLLNEVLVEAGRAEVSE